MKPNNSSPLPSNRHAAERVSVFACAVLIVVVVAAAWLSHRSYSASERESVLRHAEDMTLVLQSYIRDTLLSADDAVRRLKRDFERDGLRTDLKRLMQDHLGVADYIALVSVADAQGRVILSTLPIMRDASIANTAHFRTHVERDTGESFINNPVLGRASAKGFFHLSRRINQPDGSFAGVALVTVDPSYWGRLLRDGHFGEAADIALIGRDGAARAAFKRNGDGQALLQRDWGFIARAASEPAPQGRLTVAGPGGSNETWVYRELQAFPLLVAVKVDEAVMTGRLDAVRARHFWAALTIVVLAILFAAGLLFFISRQRRHVTETAHIVQAWRQSEERFRSAFDQAAIGMGLRPVGRPDLPWQKVNRKLCDFLGYTEKELLAQPRSAVNAPEDAGFMAEMDARLISGEVVNYSREKQFLRKDGSRVWGQVTVTVLHYLDGQSAQVLSIVQDINDRKLAEDRLSESEAWFRTMFDHAGVGISTRLARDRHAPWLAVNDKFCEMTGYSREELLRMSTAQITLPGEQDAAIRDNQRLFSGECSNYAREKQLLCKDGSRLWVVVSVALLPGVNGNADRFISTYQDINARLMAEERLREREGHLRAIIAAEPECVAIVAPDGRLLDMNPAGLRMLEAGSLEEMQRRPFLKQVTPKYRREFVRLQHRILDGDSGVLEFEAVGIAGKHRWLEIHAAPLYDAAGTITALLGIARDVTERRLARDVLAAERNLLRTVIDNLPDRVRVRDRDLRIMLANEAWRNAYAPGYSDVTGISNEDLRVPGKVGRYNAEDLAVLATGQPSSPREDVDGPPDNPSWYITTKTPLRGTLNEVIGVVSISRNVTDFKRRSMEVEKLNAALETRVAERTAQLTSANEELEAFASSVSHDLRAPLRHIDGMAAALLEDYTDKLDATGQGYLQRIRGAALRMAGLIEDLLRLSRVMRTELKLSVVDLSEIASGIADDLRREQPARKVEFLITPGLRVKGDAGLLRSVLANLLQNAWKFTGKQDAARIEFATKQYDGVTAYFVRDDGAGFDMAQVERLFGAFQRLHSEREFPGTGIGLATVRRIARRHGGEAWAEAVAGKGATFYFTLGRRPMTLLTVASEPEPARSMPVTGGSPIVEPGPVAVMLVDDEPDVLILSMRALRPDGYEVLTAGTGEAALAMLRTRAVSIIVSDFSMPGMNGAQFLAQAGAMYPDTLRIIVSGQAPNQAMQTGLRKGEIHHYFEKQHNYDEVRDCMRDWLAARGRES